MKLIIFALIFFVTSGLSFASSVECLSKIKALLKTPSEQYLFVTRSYVSKYFDLNCAVTESGDGTLNSDAYVFIHEATHFEDLQVEDTGVPNLNAKNFNLYTVNNEHIGNLENTENLPSIKSLIRPYLQKNKPSFLEEGSIFRNHHDSYIGAEDSMAAENLQGMSTETNGYTHGTIIQARLQPLLPDTLTFKNESGQEFVVANPLKGKISQAEGLYYFIYNFNLYLRLLKKEDPLRWNEFYTEKNKTFLRKLFESSIVTLKSINICELINKDNGLNFYINELAFEDLEIFEDLLGTGQVQKIICSGLKSDIEKKYWSKCRRL